MIGLTLVGIGLWWLASIAGAKTWPTTAELNRITDQIETALGRDDYSATRQLASKGLEITPLDWFLYYKRGTAEAALFFSKVEARRDFATARFLLPHWPELCLQEGKIWLAVGERDLAFDAWAEALRRSREKAPELYSQMYNVIKSDVDLLDRWRALARANRELLIIFLQHAGRLEFSLELERLLVEDRQSSGPRNHSQLRSFSRSQLDTLFSVWYEKGDKGELLEILNQNPDWKQAGWRELARIYADREDFRQACETVQEFAAPELPPPRSPQPLDKARARFLINRTDLEAGLDVYFAQINQGDVDNALVTIHELAALPNSPDYLFYLEGQLWAKKQDWRRAWQALAHFALRKG